MIDKSQQIKNEEMTILKSSPVSTNSDAKELAKDFFISGRLTFRGIIPVDLIDNMREAFLVRCRRYLDEKEHVDALTVGDKRYMITPSFEEPFTDSRAYAPEPLLSLLDVLLGSDMIISSFGTVVSLPGAKRQHVHRDHPGLFSPGLNSILPTYAVTVILPLCDLDEITGTTLVWPGSHRDFERKADFELSSAERPLLRKGDILLMDYRLVHGGEPNRSRLPRPVIYNVYSRPWFIDEKNFRKQPRLILSRDTLASIPQPLRRLFRMAS